MLLHHNAITLAMPWLYWRGTHGTSLLACMRISTGFPAAKALSRASLMAGLRWMALTACMLFREKGSQFIASEESLVLDRTK